MKKIIFLAVNILLFTSISWADEGMWLYTMLDKLKLDTKGCRLTAEQIYSINHSSLKDGIVGLAEADDPTQFFCSAELVSSQGLVLTNHHCGFEIIQKHTNLSNNYLRDGFWAKTNADELQNPGVTASILEKMIDVTDSVIPKLKGISLSKRFIMIDSIITAIEKHHAKKGYSVNVSSFFDGNAYYLFIYKTFHDVRLVGAPPESIGKFGGDTDNWMWPRHTGDFSILRIYTDKDGNPAEYSNTNIPLKTDKNLKISLKGYKKNDYAMIMGFPGSTDRYMTSYAIENKMFSNENRIKIRTMKLDIMKKFMNSDPLLNIKYSSKYAESSNYWKNFIGENKALRKLAIVDEQKAIEQQFSKWISSDSVRNAEYKNVLPDIKMYFDSKSQIQTAYDYIIEDIFYGPEMFEFAYSFQVYKRIVDKSPHDSATIDEERQNLRMEINDFFSNYDINVDKQLYTSLIQLYIDNVPSKYYPAFINTIKDKYKGNIQKYLDKIICKTSLLNKEKALAIIENRDLTALSKDPLFKDMTSVLEVLRNISSFRQIFEPKNYQAKQLYSQGIRQMHPDSLFYPDANSTPRLTYGYVGDYSPCDAVKYLHYTTLKGVMEKEDSTNNEFVVPSRLKTLYQHKDFGRYAQNDTMYVCFTTNNDITGGNSGSAVMNANGELLGIAFDGNWEALSGDTKFEPSKQKTINVDIRYVLFIIDKYAGATHLVNEMTLVQ